MKLKLYQKNGYVDIESILKFAKENNAQFIFITGGRGTGKTYTTLKYLLDNKQLFVYLRRKQTQVDIINKQDFSPFRPIAKDMKKEIISQPVTKFNAGFYYGEYDTEKEKYIPYGDCLCYTAGLTTIANLRSIGIVDDCKYIVYDEFIPEKQENAIKNEGLAFLNCVETIGRNRELKGDKPLVTICLANAMDIGNAIFDTLNLVDIADEMELKNHAYKLIPDRGILMVRLIDSPISKAKQETSLYKLTSGTEFYDMSVQNYFAFEEKGSIGRVPIKEYMLIASIGDLHFYRHKHNSLYYVTDKKVGTTRNTYTTTAVEKMRFKAEQPEIFSAYVFKEMIFDRYAIEIKFRKYFSNKR